MSRRGGAQRAHPGGHRHERAVLRGGRDEDGDVEDGKCGVSCQAGVGGAGAVVCVWY